MCITSLGITLNIVKKLNPLLNCFSAIIDMPSYTSEHWLHLSLYTSVHELDTYNSRMLINELKVPLRHYYACYGQYKIMHQCMN